MILYNSPASEFPSSRIDSKNTKLGPGFQQVHEGYIAEEVCTICIAREVSQQEDGENGDEETSEIRHEPSATGNGRSTSCHPFDALPSA